MDYVKFGKTGLGVSRLCIGCMTYGVPDRGAHPWTLDEEKSRPLIKQALEKGRKIVVFSTLHDHLKAIHRLCIKSGISGRQMGFYLGATTKAEKEHREREKVKPLLLTTYTMCAEGTNLPWLDTCILAMPRSNVNQPVGRIRREYPDKAQPVVIDILDADSPIFAAYAAARVKWYRSLGCESKEMN